MNYHDWAPPELVKLHQSYYAEISGFDLAQHDNSVLENIATKKGFKSWNSLHKCHVQVMEMLYRLATRPEMEEFWAEWFAEYQPVLSIAARGGLLGRFIASVETWHKMPKVTTNQRMDDFDAMSKHSKVLARLLKKYSHEIILNSYTQLIPREHDKTLFLCLHEKAIKKFEMSRVFWNGILPPLYEILEHLSDLALEESLNQPRNMPRKVTAENAFRTYLINCFISNHKSSKLSPTLVATFMSVALDDPLISIDSVSKTTAMKEFNVQMKEFRGSWKINEDNSE